MQESSDRKDDQNKEIITNRIEIYKEQTEVLKDYYLTQNKFYGVGGTSSIQGLRKNIFFNWFLQFKELVNKHIVQNGTLSIMPKIFCKSGNGGNGSAHLRDKITQRRSRWGDEEEGHIIVRANRKQMDSTSFEIHKAYYFRTRFRRRKKFKYWSTRKRYICWCSLGTVIKILITIKFYLNLKTINKNLFF